MLCAQFAAARYYRLAERAGSKTLGNSWYVKFVILALEFAPSHLCELGAGNLAEPLRLDADQGCAGYGKKSTMCRARSRAAGAEGSVIV